MTELVDRLRRDADQRERARMMALNRPTRSATVEMLRDAADEIARLRATLAVHNLDPDCGPELHEWHRDDVRRDEADRWRRAVAEVRAEGSYSPRGACDEILARMEGSC